MANTMRELAIKKAPKQEVLVDAVTYNSPILSLLPMQESSNGLINNYEEIMSIEGAQAVQLDEPLPTIDAVTEMKNVQLTGFGGIIQCGLDQAKVMGGKDAYFAGKLPPILRRSGQNQETSILYNSFRKYALEKGTSIDAEGDTVDSQYSILAVKFVPGETTGLYSGDLWGDGKVFDMEHVNGGNNYLDQNQVLKYGMFIKMFMGVQLANPNYVGAIYNVDLTPDGSSDTGYKALPTENQMSELVESVWGDSRDTMLMMHPKVKSALGSYKSAHLQTNVLDKDLDRTFDMWDNVKMVSSRNFKPGTEAIVA